MKKLLTFFSVMAVVAVITTLFAGCSSSNEFRVDLEKQEIVPESSLKYVTVVVGTPHQKNVSLQRENSHFQQKRYELLQL